MSARTCLLCGKPLSRIKVGSGEDFCSREHRNQYRLRRGMDRLQEANQVASLMRRRENPKPISALRPLSAAPDCRHAFGLANLRVAPRAIVARATFPLSGAARLRFSTGFAPLPPLPPAHSGGGRRPAGVARFSPQTVAPPAPAGRLAMQAEVPAAGFAALNREPVASRRARRPFGPQRHPVPPIQIVGSRSAHTRFQWLVQGGRPSRLALPQKIGNALRVSTSVGFRLATPACGAPRFVLVGATGLRRPGFALLASPAVPRRSARPLGIAMAVSTPGLWSPAPPAHQNGVGMAWPSLVAFHRNGAEWNGGGRPQGCERPAQRPPAVAQDALQVQVHWTCFAEDPALRLFNLQKNPAGPPQGHHLALAPFSPQETPFGYPSTARDMASVAPVIETPGPAPPPPAPHRPTAFAVIEERFDNGWDDWIGGVADWKLDAAGVRTGSLALFIPSLDIADYELEFLARIEKRSVAWAFRAAGLRDYYLGSIVRTAAGYEFARSTVKDGVPDKPIKTPLGAKPNAKAFTVKLRARGDFFAVSVDGRPIAQWTDSRFSSGGIGFTSAPDDPARLYWIRLAPCKEDLTL